MKNKSYINDYYFSSDVGKIRLANEDRANILKNDHGDILMLVADGMGGHKKGDYASKLALDVIEEEFKKFPRGFFTTFVLKMWLQEIILKANKVIYDTSEKYKECKGMGTTLVALLIHKKKIIVLNTGDSRAYIYKDNKLERLSEDQSLVDYLKRSGQISEDEAEKREDKNVLMNALGIFPSISLNSKTIRYHNEPLLICSDGLFNNVKEEEISQIISKGLSSNLTVKELINAANRNGGNDNISVCFFKRREA